MVAKMEICESNLLPIMEGDDFIIYQNSFVSTY